MGSGAGTPGSGGVCVVPGACPDTLRALWKGWMRKAGSQHWPASLPPPKTSPAAWGIPTLPPLSRSQAHSCFQLPPYGLASTEHPHPSLHCPQTTVHLSCLHTGQRALTLTLPTRPAFPSPGPTSQPPTLGTWCQNTPLPWHSFSGPLPASASRVFCVMSASPVCLEHKPCHLCEPEALGVGPEETCSG